MKLKLLAVAAGVFLIAPAHFALGTIATSDISTAKLYKDDKLWARAGTTGLLEDVISGVLHRTDDAARIDLSSTSKEVEPSTLSAQASTSASLPSTFRQSRAAGKGTTSLTAAERKRLKARKDYLRLKALAEAKGTTLYHEKIQRLTKAGQLEAWKANEAKRVSRPRDRERQRELRLEKHVKNGGTVESFEEMEQEKRRQKAVTRRLKTEAAREAAERVHLQQHLERGGTRESFKPAKPMQRRQRKRKSIRAEADFTLPSAMRRQSTTATIAAEVHATPPAAHPTQTQTRQQQAPITHPHGLLPDVSQEHLPATPSAPRATPLPVPEPATPMSPSTLHAWVDSLLVDYSPP